MAVLARVVRHCLVAQRLQAALAGHCIVWLADYRPCALRVAWLAGAAAWLVVATMAARLATGRALAATVGGGATWAFRAVAVELGLGRRDEALQVAFFELLTGH